MHNIKVKEYDVIIVGIGMIGSALAAGLAMYGFKIAVVDKTLPMKYEKNQTPDLRVSALNKRSEKLLRRIGAWKNIESMRLCPYKSLEVWEKYSPKILHGFEKAKFDARQVGFEELGYIVENRIIQLAVIKELQKSKLVDIYHSAKIKDVKSSYLNHEVVLDDNMVLRSELLVGADGSQSIIRTYANIGWNYQPYQQKCLVATIEIDNSIQDVTWQAFTPTGPEAFLPLANVNGKSYGSIVWYHHTETINWLMSLSNEHFVYELQRTFSKRLPKVLQVKDRGDFTISKGHASHYFNNSIVLVGDSAHTINPLAGQGANLGFRDVIWLIEALLNAKYAKLSIGSLDILKNYEINCKGSNNNMLKAMDCIHNFYIHEGSTIMLARKLFFPLVGQIKPLMLELAKFATGGHETNPSWL